MGNSAQITFNGQIHQGLIRLKVRQALDAVAVSFEAEFSQGWSTNGKPEWLPIQPGSSTEILWGNLSFKGFVDTIQPQLSKEAGLVTVSGRETTADLIDASAEGGPWKDQGLADIATAICQPFGIQPQITGAAGGKFSHFALNPGETAFEALERLARHRGLLLISNGWGGLEIGKPMPKPISTALQGGSNLLAADMQVDYSGRFSSVKVVGQAPANPFATAETDATPEAKATDNTITRHRPLVLVAEEGQDEAGLQSRADWELTVRKSRSQVVRCTVQGWEHEEGAWKPQQQCRVVIPAFGLNTDLMVTAVEWQLDENGTRSQLVLMPPGAFDVLATPESQEVGGWP